MKKIKMIIEKADEGFLGRVEFEDNLILEEAEDLNELEDKIKNTLKEFHKLDSASVTFTYETDITALFEKFRFLKIATIADLAGLNQSLVRQYANGIKFPSENQAKKIQDALHRIGNDLINLQITT